jgi:hypothetical protein
MYSEVEESALPVLSIILSVLTTAALGVWCYYTLGRSELWSARFESLSRRLLAWMLVTVFAIISVDKSSVPNPVISVVALGGMAGIGLCMVLSAWFGHREDEAERRRERLAGIPNKPKMLKPWKLWFWIGAPVGIATYAIWALFLVSAGQQYQQKLNGVFDTATIQNLYSQAYKDILIATAWTFGIWLVVTVAAVLFQRYKVDKAWDEYRELRKGIEESRVSQ